MRCPQAGGRFSRSAKIARMLPAREALRVLLRNSMRQALQRSARLKLPLDYLGRQSESACAWVVQRVQCGIVFAKRPAVVRVCRLPNSMCSSKSRSHSTTRPSIACTSASARLASPRAPTVILALKNRDTITADRRVPRGAASGTRCGHAVCESPSFTATTGIKSSDARSIASTGPAAGPRFAWLRNQDLWLY